VSNPSITQRERWKYILLIGGLQTLQPFTLDPYLPSGPIIARSFEVPDSMIQLTFSALTLGFALESSTLTVCMYVLFEFFKNRAS
jgi:DHA1 family bicyclomycin/chloramphenicol resistance-like MFS transporter